MEKVKGQGVKVKGTVIGQGIPKVCVSLTAGTREGILAEAGEVRDYPADIVEWRADRFERLLEEEETRGVLNDLQAVLGGRPLLFTLRSQREGGTLSVRPEVYAGLLGAAVRSGLIDLVDVEAFTEDGVMGEVIREAKKNGVAVIASYHDVEKTPSKEGMVQRLLKMGETGADILKLAVMASSRHDVLTLLDATLTMDEQHPERPVILVSMGKDGLLSRMAGEIFGSAMTFASVGGRLSAPGQVDARALAQVLDVIHGRLAE